MTSRNRTLYTELQLLREAGSPVNARNERGSEVAYARHLTFLVAVAAITAAAFAPSRAEADVCVWRDPERTMTKLFPNASDYRTVTKRVTPELARAIEERAGVRLDDSERTEFNFYEITGRAGGRTERLGTVLALAGTGDYGAVEVVIGLGPDERVLGTYVQRTRERHADKLRSDEFLSQFRGRSAKDSPARWRDVRLVDEAPTASRAVAVAVHKMVVFYDALH